MLRILLASVLSAQAARVQVHEVTQSKAKFGASCEALQTNFHNRVVAFQTLLDEHQNLDDISQVTVMMRTYGIIRTLRRARTCTWVIENDSEDLEQARSITRTLLADNPCAEAARSELDAGASAETQEVELRSIQRAMTILNSDTCEISETNEHSIDLDDDAAVDAELTAAEDELHDVVEELDESGSSFTQMDSTTGTRLNFMRSVGVFFMMILLLLACVGVIAIIAFFITYAAVALITGPCASCHDRAAWLAIYGMFGAAGTAAIGLGPCAYQTYNHLF